MTFSGIKQWILCTSSGRKFYLTPPNSADFLLVFHPQNPPPAMAYRFESGHQHQSNIIRTRSSLREMGSDYLYSLTSSRKPIFETVSSSDQNQSPEGREKRNWFRRTLLWIRRLFPASSISTPPVSRSNSLTEAWFPSTVLWWKKRLHGICTKAVSRNSLLIMYQSTMWTFNLKGVLGRIWEMWRSIIRVKTEIGAINPLLF